MSEWHRRDPLNRNPASARASALYRAIGLGSAKSGAHHWWLQRVTAVALVPLLLWLVVSLLAHARGGHQAVALWLGRPAVAVTMAVLLVALFWHMKLGLRVIVEDYVHADRVKFAALAAVDLVCVALMAIGVFTSLYLAFR
ncbi:succinate dehydrogenase [Rhodanobacter thiooxydans]|uniref:Succinate dehydrogenase hydrophobic membrane anchor subunit n=1 Tax=Rhodanobacter thiooxydans TaxID=416169 RepID=A0A154QH03_9GAMM|nr:succinate dehydrogenase, hydrophobic membrane anchor protein [Rhodanobacter thiooxydans]KZC23437.1 succinate dehydrogenase [Rhodanobacter thiooxydans]MCW0200331.1 succinate dehydrogenase, hydrophobic membrane anchor protein [Rhodanobacter thiooxydans]